MFVVDNCCDNGPAQRALLSRFLEEALYKFSESINQSINQTINQPINQSINGYTKDRRYLVSDGGFKSESK
jgi:hypothetical protein